MPELTIVASWRVMIVRSLRLDRLAAPGRRDLLGLDLLGDVEDDQPAAA